VNVSRTIQKEACLTSQSKKSFFEKIVQIVTNILAFYGEIKI
jgi:hypothetical protein